MFYIFKKLKIFILVKIDSRTLESIKMARDIITFSITVKSINSNAVQWNGAVKGAWRHVVPVQKSIVLDTLAQVDGRLTKI